MIHCNPNDRAPITACEGIAHRYDVGLSPGGRTVIYIHHGGYGEDSGPWTLATVVTDPSPKDLTEILNHAFMAGMEHEAYNRDCGED